MRLHFYLTLFCLVVFNHFVIAQVGINTVTPRNTAVLELESEFGNGSFGGFMMPRITSTNQNSLTANLTSLDEGMLVFITDLREVQIWNGELLKWEILFTFNNSAPVANSVTITGTMRAGELVNGSYSFFDADGDPEGNSTFNWYTADDTSGTNQVLIVGATSNSYTLTTSETNSFIGFSVTPTALRGTSPGIETVFYNETPVAEEIILWINEIHYNNIGGDIDEGIEIAGTAGIDLTNYSLVFYNGSTSSVYDSINLSGVIPDQSNGLGTLFFANAGIQNGNPDGIALVNEQGVVIQFLSYGGIITANGGSANGLTSVNIGVTENDMTGVGLSLQLQGAGNRYTDFSWAADVTATQSLINSGQTFN